MIRFVVRRLAFGVVVLWVVSTAVFFLVFVAAGKPERVIGGPRATTETLRLIRRNLGLDEPLIVQYARFLGRLLQGDLGQSYINGAPVASMIGGRLQTTVVLVLGASVLWFAGGVLTGVLSATRARSFFDRLATLFVLAGLSMPAFVVALLMLYVLFSKAGDAGIHLFEPGPPLQENFWKRMTLPWLALAFLLMAGYTRLTRGAMLDVLGEDYIRTARSKGLPERRVVYRHALRAALTPVVTQFGVDVGVLIGSTIVTEKVFGLQGVGQLVVQSITVGDAPVILGVVLAVALCVVVANLLVDIAYSYLDPRVRLS
ncbi:ABC transporter permease [Actinomadura rudentiformis]|uniref:ABC transporter permease n=1 Tax=Actinomadura rudentiformis TaxID=359158 RepID=A0A6H9YTJ7_9ACTN|nr:ABC transporter permease [Actinomadura rudentiformis]KAB2348944.1 ABC transporter permease [Actinomadura rudentiformis]